MCATRERRIHLAHDITRLDAELADARERATRWDAHLRTVRAVLAPLIARIGEQAGGPIEQITDEVDDIRDVVSRILGLGEPEDVIARFLDTAAILRPSVDPDAVEIPGTTMEMALLHRLPANSDLLSRVVRQVVEMWPYSSRELQKYSYITVGVSLTLLVEAWLKIHALSAGGPSGELARWQADEGIAITYLIAAVVDNVTYGIGDVRAERLLDGWLSRRRRNETGRCSRSRCRNARASEPRGA